MSDPDDPMNVHDYDLDQLRELLIIERRSYRELSQANAARLKRIDDLREEKLLVESQLQSALAKLETIDKINQQRPRLHLRSTSQDLIDKVAAYIVNLEKESQVLHLDLENERQARWAAADNLKRYTDKELDSADLQLVCLALAELALRRRGMAYAVDQVADKLGGVVAERHVAAFKKTSADLVKPLERGELTTRSNDDVDDSGPSTEGDPTSGG